jgi:hypothetical protein
MQRRRSVKHIREDYKENLKTLDKQVFFYYNETKEMMIVSTVMDKNLNQVLRVIKPKSVKIEVENLLIALRLLGFEINARIGTWAETKSLEKLIEYAILLNDKEYRIGYAKNKISFILSENKIDMFVIRVENKIFNIDALNDLVKQSDEVRIVYNEGREFILNCTNIKLVKEIISCLKKCIK